MSKKLTVDEARERLMTAREMIRGMQSTHAGLTKALDEMDGEYILERTGMTERHAMELADLDSAYHDRRLDTEKRLASIVEGYEAQSKRLDAAGNQLVSALERELQRDKGMLAAGLGEKRPPATGEAVPTQEELESRRQA